MVAVSFLAIPAVAEDVVKIGAIYSLTGPIAAVAKLQKQGAAMAVKEVNEAGGVDIGGKKTRLEAIFADDQTKSDVATQLFEGMVREDGVSAVIGGSVAHVPHVDC